MTKTIYTELDCATMARKAWRRILNKALKNPDVSDIRDLKYKDAKRNPPLSRFDSSCAACYLYRASNRCEICPVKEPCIKYVSWAERPSQHLRDRQYNIEIARGIYNATRRWETAAKKGESNARNTR